MCGISGFLTAGGLPRSFRAIADHMAKRLDHRGPDSSGRWFDQEVGIALVHTRLAVLDLSPAGAQPMVSASGRYIIAFNGEIYNFKQLRSRLDQGGRSPKWNGHSDTEVLLACMEAWGLDKTLESANGMFALAVWDRHQRALYLARDRIGEKPLFYGHTPAGFVFASELKAIKGVWDFRPELNHEAVNLYLRHSYVPGPLCIWKGLQKLQPGHVLRVDLTGGETLMPYWELSEVVSAAKDAPVNDYGAALEELDLLLSDAVGLRMESDVPLGAFLSGGIDSTLMVALMQKQSANAIQTFTIGYHETEFDESRFSREIANHLGTNHTELIVHASDGMDCVTRLSEIWDEPFADSSQIPTLMVSELTRQKVTVSISGDAGDELFGGYNRYLTAMQVWKAKQRIPQVISSLSAKALSTRAVIKAAAFLSARSKNARAMLLEDRIPKVAQVLSGNDEVEFYRRLISHQQTPHELLVAKDVPTFDPLRPHPLLGCFEEQMMYLDTLTYLPDDILTKVDRASMTPSLESRVPFLDPRVIEFAWRLPIEFKIANGKGKRILRDILDKYVPSSLMERPKMGFSVPIDGWLRDEMRDWAEHLLDEKRLKEGGVFEPAKVRKLWDDHLADRARRHYQLWDILMFQAWHANQEEFTS